MLATSCQPAEGTGVTAGVAATSVPPDLAAAEAFLSKELGVPVDLTIEDPYRNAGRQNDSPPWYAGGRTKIEIRKDVFSNCSTGWAVKVGDDEKLHLLTAAHCADKDAKVLNGDRSRELGTVAGRDKDLDSAIIGVASASATMFTGRPTSSTTLVREKAIEVKVGAWICGSGGFDRTELRHQSRQRQRKDRDRDRVGQDHHQCPCLPRTEVTCRRDDDTATCNRRMAFVPIDTLLKHWKATLVVSG